MQQPAPASTARPVRVRLLVAAVLIAVVGGFAAATMLTADRWAPGAGDTERTTITWQPAQPAEATSDDLDRAREVLEDRVAARGVDDATVTVDGDTITLSAPGADERRWRELGAVGMLNVRPVVNAIPAQEDGTPAGRPIEPTAQRIADEMQLRQSEDPSIQLLALQFQATRCGQDDVLAGHDDPELPLITCSRDGRTVYLLGETVADGSGIERSDAAFDDASNQWVVDVQFDEDAAAAWQTFTAADIGSQAAFTLDTAVVSAPEIVEEIADGRARITGGFTRDTAGDLVAVLRGGTLPLALTVQSARTETVVPQYDPTVWRVGVVVAGVLVAAIVTGGALLIARLGRAGRREADYAADVTRYTS